MERRKVKKTKEQTTHIEPTPTDMFPKVTDVILFHLSGKRWVVRAARRSQLSAAVKRVSTGCTLDRPAVIEYQEWDEQSRREGEQVPVIS